MNIPPDTIVIGADHAGFPLKEALKPGLVRFGVTVADVGTISCDSVDYPDIGRRVASGVSSGTFDGGILICGSGVGMSIVANKYPGVRAALCLDEGTARLSRLHNDSNILCLAARRTAPETAQKILTAWLETAFEGGRHDRRIEKIREIEKEVCKHQVKQERQHVEIEKNRP